MASGSGKATLDDGETVLGDQAAGASGSSERAAGMVPRTSGVMNLVRLEGTDREPDAGTEAPRVQTDERQVEILGRAQLLLQVNAALRQLHDELDAREQERAAELRKVHEDLQREIAERQRAEEALRQCEAQLRHSQKLETIGRLAGRVARDLNNLLTVILAYSSLLLSELRPDAEGRSDVEAIQLAGVRAAELTRQLLAFGRAHAHEPRILNLNEIVSGLTKMLARLLGENVELRVNAAPDLWRVCADRGQIEQVILNLALNARDAMPGGGRLTVETANVVLDEADARLDLGSAPGPYVMLAFSDTGLGMDETARAQVFEPFFTTKDLGKGTGLGLSTVSSIVQQCGGSILVYSEPGKGTTFRIYLPEVDEPALRAATPTTSCSTRYGV